MADPLPLTLYRFDVEAGDKSYFVMCDEDGSNFIGNTMVHQGHQFFICGMMPFYKPKAHERVYTLLSRLRWEPMQGEPFRVVRENEILVRVVADDNDLLVNGRWWVCHDEPANQSVWNAIVRELKAYAIVWWAKALILIALVSAVAYGYFFR